MTNLFLTIIIPTYNRPHLLPRAVESALGQTLDEIEVIVVDE
ncbi:MAG: glycosyltransferase family 2 protein, partial [Desertifilum sp. SIO1I2]|nr:glycosyltransferase family 2 protein [Desertifilum sp. SIO1I2]